MTRSRDDRAERCPSRGADRRRWLAVLVALMALVLAFGQAQAQPAADGGTVSIPLATWQSLAGAGQRDLPGWGLSQATVTATATDASVDVSLSVRVQVLDEGRTLVPLLPAGVTGARLRVDNADAPLLATPHGLAWVAPRAATYSAVLSYSVEPRREGTGWVAALPLPPLPSGTLSASFAGGTTHASAVPLRSPTTSRPGSGMVLSGELPATSMVQLAWQGDRTQGGGATRSRYEGVLRGETVAWNAEFTVHHASEGATVVPLLPSDVALVSIAVDGADAPVAVVDGRFAVEVSGRGRHTVRVAFETPVLRDRGAPRVDLVIPEVPMSQFELVLPGDKQVQSDGSAGVVTEAADGRTRARLNVAMTSRVSISWSEAIPEPEVVELRASANLIHLVHAEERLLNVRALATWEIARGEANSVELLAPEGIQFNTITSPLGTVADWRIAADAPRRLVVFFDRPMTGQVPLELTYERTIGGEGAEELFTVPLLEPLEVSRQRGLLALLSSDEVALEPDGDGGATRVGENQLPPEVRDEVTMTVAHTFRYNEDVPSIRVRATQPPRQEVRFDATVDTLVSLGDVTTRVAASVEVIVKQGRLMELDLVLPGDVNLLQLTAPSLRTQSVRTEGDEQIVHVEFTRELEGRFRLEASWEKIQADGAGDFEVPRVRVAGAEVEQGRIAVEALSAVEVQPSATEHLSSLDIAELPQQLVLRTTNPILMAFRYVQVDPRPRLSLRVTRHEELAVQSATIDEAHYRTLVTEDGFAVTQVRFLVRNHRRQFLRVTLPAGAEVWAAAVDGRAETPALAADGAEEAGSEVLLRIRSSDAPFAVDLEYKAPIASLGRFGRLRAELPRPDMVVTRTTWDVWLPASLLWGEPEGDLQLASNEGGPAARFAVDEAFGSAVSLPEQGVHLRFEKLYANQGDATASFSIPYTSSEGRTLRTLLTRGGGLAVWVGLLLLALVPGRRALGGAVAGAGLAALLVAVAWAGEGSGVVVSSLLLPALPAVVVALGVLAVRWWRRVRPTGADA